MKIENKFREGLKNMIKTTPLDEINVVSLSKKVNSNRQTFYYHFRDISDVIESIFLKEKIVSKAKPHDFESIAKPLIAYINSNKQFLLSVANSFANDKLQEFIYSYFYQKIGQYLKSEKKNLPTNVAFYIQRYLSTLLSREFYFWLMNKKEEKQTHLMRRLLPIWDYFMNSYSLTLKGNK